MERTDEFERRALAAAGPVFLVALGLAVLLVLAVLVVVSPGIGPLALGLLTVGVVVLVVGLLWGLAKNRRSARGGS